MRQKPQREHMEFEEVPLSWNTTDTKKRKEIVSGRDVIARLRYGGKYRLMYVGGVGLSCFLLVVGAITNELESTWYLTLEAMLTCLFVMEVMVQIWLTGVGTYFSQSPSNVFEFSLCVACCAIFGLSVSKRVVRYEFEVVLLSVRYITQLGRLYFMLKTQRAPLSQRKIEIHEYDNPGITRSAPLDDRSPALWTSDEFTNDLFNEVV